MTAFRDQYTRVSHSGKCCGATDLAQQLHAQQRIVALERGKEGRARHTWHRAQGCAAMLASGEASAIRPPLSGGPARMCPLAVFPVWLDRAALVTLPNMRCHAPTTGSGLPERPFFGGTGLLNATDQRWVTRSYVERKHRGTPLGWRRCRRLTVWVDTRPTVSSGDDPRRRGSAYAWAEGGACDSLMTALGEYGVSP